jgi:hypothetical protein
VSYDSTILADGPVLFLPGSSDTSGHGHTVGVHGTPVATTMPNGDAALAYDGVDDYLEVADAADLSVDASGGGTAITIEAWIRPDVLQFPHDESSGYVHWAGKGETGAHEWACRMYSQITTETPSRPNRISGYCFNASGGLGVGSYFQDLITAGAWLHYVLVISAIPAAGNDPNGFPLDHGSTSVWKNSVLRDQDGLNQAGAGGLGLMVPTPGPAPVRVATRDLGSFFQGAIGKFAVYPYALSGAQILAHYNAMLPFPVGSSIYAGALPGLDTLAGVGATSVITLASTVPVGDTIIARVAQSYTDGGGSMTDSKGNTWVRDDSGKDASQTMRVSTFSCQVTTQLVSSDTVTITWGSTPALPTVRMCGLDQFRRTGTLDTHNEAAYASTSKPGGNIPVTPALGNDLLLGSVLLAGDNSISYDQPPGYTALPRIGGSGRPFTVGGGWRSVGTYVNVLRLASGNVRPHNPRSSYTYEPQLGSAQSAVELLTAYRGV